LNEKILGVSTAHQLDAGMVPLEPKHVQALCDKKKAYYISLMEETKVKFPYKDGHIETAKTRKRNENNKYQ